MTLVTFSTLSHTNMLFVPHLICWDLVTLYPTVFFSGTFGGLMWGNLPPGIPVLYKSTKVPYIRQNIINSSRQWSKKTYHIVPCTVWCPDSRENMIKCPLGFPKCYRSLPLHGCKLQLPSCLEVHNCEAVILVSFNFLFHLFNNFLF